MSNCPHKRKRKPWHKLTAQQVDCELAAQTVEDRVVSTWPRKVDFVFWDSPKGPSRRKSIQILDAPNSAAHGMRLIYGRGDHFGRLSCGMDMLLRKDGRVFVRFYSPGKRVTYRTYELVGLQLPPLPERGKLLEDNCVPEILRDLYDDWAGDCVCNPDDIG